MNGRHFAGLLITLLLAGGGAYWFLDNFEEKEIPLPSPASGEARTNHLYAAELFLQDMGIEADTVPLSVVQQGNTSPRTALILDEQTPVSQSLHQDLLRWVANGGTLITTPHETWARAPCDAPDCTDNDQVDLPLSALGIYASEAEEGHLGDKPAVLFMKTADGHAAAIKVERNTSIGLDGARPGDRVVHDQGSLFIIQRPYGQGRIIAVADLYMLDNENIGHLDNAAFLWGLLRQPGVEAEQALLVSPDEHPPLWQLLWQHARPLVVMSALLVLFWLLGGLARFGPLLPPAQSPRRQWLEHIRASGELYWQQGQAQRLLDATRHALLHRLLQQHPHLQTIHEQDNASELAIAIAEISHQPRDTIEALLHHPAAMDRQAFTVQIQQLETLRKRL
ncbi:MAG: DUF4350 domain-containing protein [bacterium]